MMEMGMVEIAGDKSERLEKALRGTFWGAAALLMLAPFIVVQFGDGLRWDAADFIFVAVVIGIAGLIFEGTMRLARSWTHRFAIGLAVVAAFLIVLANGAVGIIGNEDNPYNVYFFGVIALALTGAVLARFRAAEMALAMAVAGIAQVAVALCGLAADPRGAVFSAMFGGLWLLSAALFNVVRNQDSPLR
jgi:MFS family permease